MTLDLHETDQIRITVCGFEADEVHDLMGRSTAIPARVVSERATHALAAAAAATIRDEFVRLVLVNPGEPNENAVLSTVFKAVPPPSRPGRQTVRTRSPKQEYRIEYTISR